MESPRVHTMTLDEVAAELGYTPAGFRRARQRLERTAGFPRPLPVARLVWSRALVVSWIKAAGLASQAAANDDAPAQVADCGDALIARQRAALRDLDRF